jgi:cell pole-organizing protein PopZ
MSQTAKAQEPSMEEILASIRRIIADDDAKPPVKPVEAPKAAAPVRPVPAPRPAPANSRQDEIDAVLADLQSGKTGPKPAAPGSDVLDLTEAMAATPSAPATFAPPSAAATPASAAPPPAFRTIDGASDVVFTDRAGEAQEAPRQQPAPVADRGLMSAATRAAVDSAFNSLANTVLGNNARTLEDLVKEMLRPMLKSWIDDNLPDLVERIVRAEIERVSRGR